MEKETTALKDTNPAIKWSDRQLSALENDCDLLVSASAGSGKTTVMIERIFRYIDNGGDIRRLVVLTFTRASAYDMKEKLIQKLYDKIRQGHKEGHRLREQIKHMQNAFICTIDSFCGDIYRRYFEDIDGSPIQNIIDDAEERNLLYKAIDETMQEWLSQGDASFKEFIYDVIENRNINKLKEKIEILHKFLFKLPDPLDYIAQINEINKLPFDENPAVAYYINDEKRKAGFRYSQAEALLTTMHKLESMGQELPKIHRDKYINSLQQYADNFNSIVHAVGIKGFLRAMQDISVVSAPTDRKVQEPEALETLRQDMKAYFKESKDYLDKCKSVLRLENLPDGVSAYDYYADIEQSARVHYDILLTLVVAVSQRYKELKTQDNKVDFNDLEHFALKIFSNDKIANEFREQIDFIFIDEYQDTNYLQEEIIRRISKDNVFMVGDVKQSIYKFRHAEPNIFLDKRKGFLATNMDSVVDLNDNYRSHPHILEFINLIFDQIMTADFGGISYKDEARLTQGAPYELDKDIPPVSVAYFEEEEGAHDYPPVYSVMHGDIKQAQSSKEAVYIADKVECMVGKRLIYDKELKSMRKITYRDIAILTSKKEAGDIFVEFVQRKIPYNAVDFRGDVEYDDIIDIISILKILDNYQQDIPLAASMLSYIGGFSQNDLAEIRLNTDCQWFWQAVKSYDGDDYLKQRITMFFDKINSYRQLSSVMSVNALINHILSASGFDGYLISQEQMGRIEYINAFVYGLTDKDYAKNLSDFLAWYEQKPQTNINLVPFDDNCISFMSIHKSKGLEYPIVFLANIHGERNSSESSRIDLFIDKEYGIATSFKDSDEQDKVSTLSVLGFKAKYRWEEREEFARTLYVAMTRAKNHLFITGTQAGKEAKSYLDECRSYRDWIDYACARNPEIKQRFFEKEKVSNSAVYEDITKSAVIKKHATPRSYQQRGDGEVFNFDIDYPHQKATTTNNKYSVSELSSQKYLRYNEESSPQVAIWGADKAEIGTYYHQFMEYVDIFKCSKDEIVSQISNMISDGRLDGQYQLDIDILYSVLNSKLFDIARKSKVLREQPFILYQPASDFLAGGCSDKILIQGVIDMLIIGSENILVDYKVSSLSADLIKLRYKEQINLYTTAVEKLMKIPLDKRIIYIINQNKAVEL